MLIPALTEGDTLADQPNCLGRSAVLVFGDLVLGGAERQALHFAEYLQQHHDFRISVYGLYGGEGPLVDECDRLGIAWRALGLHPSSNVLCLVAQSVVVGQMLREERPTVVLPYCSAPNVFCGLTWRLSGARMCIWNQRDMGLYRLPALYERNAVRLTPHFVANSGQGGRFLVQELGVSPHQLTIILNGVQLASPVSSRHEWRQRLQAPQDSLVTVMVANLMSDVSKDHPTLLRAWRIVQSKLASVGKEAVLVLAGHSYGNNRARLIELAQELEISESVRLLGFEKDISGLLEASDIALYSSKTEGLPNAVLESMACGLPIVATDIPGVREALGPGNRNWLCPPYSHQRFAELVLAFCDSQDLRDRVGSANLLRAQSRFSVTRMCEETFALVESTLT